MIRQLLRAPRTNDEGFTLIELLIVVVILGVLSGIVVFAVGAFHNDGVTAACKADKKNVEVAAEAYYAKNTAYPANPSVLVTASYLKETPQVSVTINPTDGAVTASGC